VAEDVFDALRAPIRRVTAPDMQIPFSPVLEAELYPTTEKIAAAIWAVCGKPEPRPSFKKVEELHT
jgi:pyruvate dehydrogenase E1 component beta subunit